MSPGQGKISTFLAARRCDGLAAPFFREGAVNPEVVTAYLRHVLCPELKQDASDILAHLSTHKLSRVTELISAQGATTFRYLPAYRPALNPIEMAFAKLTPSPGCVQPKRKCSSRKRSTDWRRLAR